MLRLFCIILAVLLLVTGCSNSGVEKQEILKTLTIRSSAINSRNIAQYVSVISTNYNDKGKTFVQIKENLEKNFSDSEQILYEPNTPSITVAGSSAESVSSYRMKVRVRGKELTLNGTEHLSLAKEPGGWKIIAGI